MTAVDWDLLEIPEVMAACQDAASYVTRKYHHVLEYDDALQEAYLYVATHPSEVGEYVAAEEFANLKHRIHSRVTDVARSYHARSRNDVSLEALTAAWENK